MMALITTCIAVFLGGAFAGMLGLIICGIRRGERARLLTQAPRSGLETVARRALIGIRDGETGP